MKESVVKKVALKSGESIRYKDFLIWKEVPYIKNTAVCFIQILPEGVYLITDSEKFTPFFNGVDLVKFVDQNFPYLGICNDCITKRNQKRWYYANEINFQNDELALLSRHLAVSFLEK